VNRATPCRVFFRREQLEEAELTTTSNRFPAFGFERRLLPSSGRRKLPRAAERRASGPGPMRFRGPSINFINIGNARDFLFFRSFPYRISQSGCMYADTPQTKKINTTIKKSFFSAFLILL